MAEPLNAREKLHFVYQGLFAYLCRKDKKANWERSLPLAGKLSLIDGEDNIS